MKRKFPDLVCAECGSNRFKFPKSVEDEVRCEECGYPVATLSELQARISGHGTPAESRTERQQRHADEVARSHEDLRASVAETDRLVVASNEMLRRHRQEDLDAGD